MTSQSFVKMTGMLHCEGGILGAKTDLRLFIQSDSCHLLLLHSRVQIWEAMGIIYFLFNSNLSNVLND